MTTFVGSIFAAIKLQGLRGFRGMILLPGRNYLNAILVLGMIASGIPFIIKKPISGWYLMIVFSALAAFFGFHFVTAIGGADMPVVISILNSMSGWAGVMEGFGVGNNLLITTGALVGSSGGILSYIMCRAMNRSFINVFKGGKLAKKKKKNKGEEEAKTIQEIDLDGAAEILKNAKKIIIAPGYGMAVARAQHAVSEMSKLLRSFNRDVTFGIHPVAGRLPGHMNVLLAEAQVPYDIVFSMEEVNPTIEENDVAIVIGANDTVNPAAIEDPDSIIAGMPVVEVWKTNTVIVIKRSMRAGYAGIENPLFYKENTRMLFGDAKDVVQNLFVKLKSMDLGAPKGSGAKKKDDFSTDTSDSETHNLIDKDKNGDDLMLDKVDNNLQSLHNTYMKVGVVKEIAENARIVAITPDICEKLLKYGFETLVETGAGALAKYSDTQYKRAGATILPSAEEVWKTADIILKLDPPQINEKTGVHEIDLLPENGMLVSWLWPDRNPDLIKRLQAKKATALAMDLVPRISRSQRLDARSSMAKVGGYRAVVESSYHYEKFFLGEVTAAGKYPPAIVMIIGAGVAGLAAIGTAKNLGAIVRAFDTPSRCQGTSRIHGRRIFRS
ncbi:nicotinamide nucleotide transhydrogenase 2 [Anaeramoeba ignava]|uniref:proton-translocating NAD(P)(+) transhydrogenase n=1 Tax=Anaeramoeba ignava TaxID=1746090 RepID=A0A9Q0RGS4_ANAIG|nr:nicotinamide nucleotide transhydrogenase 2 [Anaeramoeba ignava]